MSRRKHMSGVATTLGPRGRGMGLGAIGRKGGGTVRHVAGAMRMPMGDDITTPTVADPLDDIRAKTSEILMRIKQDQENRRIALYIAGASALFAAVKLGIIAFPHLRSRIKP